MKIIILGAGQVGTALAEHLANEYNDVTVIDLNEERLRNLQEHLDILAIAGNAAHPSILKRGGAEEADMIIAVTSQDETNLVACQVAATLYQTPTKIARVRSVHYLSYDDLFGATAFPIDVLISPERTIASYVYRLIEYPDAQAVFDFADQQLFIIQVKAKADGGPMVGEVVGNLSHYLGSTPAEITAIFREGKAIIPQPSTTIKPQDEVYFLTPREHVQQVISTITPLSPPNQRVIIAGGGNIGTHLASALEDEFRVKLLEKNPTRVESLAAHLTKSILLQGDASDVELLMNEGIDNTDVFCALTNQVETNIMSGLLAKRLGCRRVFSLVTRASYVDLIEGGKIDRVISPQQVTIGSLLTHVRRGHVVNVHALRRGQAEAIEIIARGSAKTSKIVGRTIKNVAMPPETTIAGLVRGNRYFMGHENVEIEADDHVIVLLLDKRKIKQVERLFQEESSMYI